MQFNPSSAITPMDKQDIIHHKNIKCFSSTSRMRSIFTDKPSNGDINMTNQDSKITPPRLVINGILPLQKHSSQHHVPTKKFDMVRMEKRIGPPPSLTLESYTRHESYQNSTFPPPALLCCLFLLHFWCFPTEKAPILHSGFKPQIFLFKVVCLRAIAIFKAGEDTVMSIFLSM